MRKLASIAATLILTISICAAVTAQTSSNSTQASVSPVASDPALPRSVLSDEQIKAQLIADLKMFRELYELTKLERDDAVIALELEKTNSASLAKSYAAAEESIARLNLALDRYEKTVELLEKAIGLTEKQRDDARADAKRANKRTAIVTAILVVKTLAEFIF